MPAIKDIQKTFGHDERFQMISLSLDETAEEAERYIKENGLIWTHGFAGNMLAGVSAGKVYKVRSIPATFLIGPDGHILAKNSARRRAEGGGAQGAGRPRAFRNEGRGNATALKSVSSAIAGSAASSRRNRNVRGIPLPKLFLE